MNRRLCGADANIHHNRPTRRQRSLSSLLTLWLAIATFPVMDSGSFVNAQEATAADNLALRQSQLADRYSRLEKLILRMAEFDAADNPRRSELLKEAFALSKDRRVQFQLEELVRLLQEDKLSRAVSNQGTVSEDLKALLELLLTEDRSDRLKDEQRRIKDYIREIERIERMQRSVQGRTEGGVEMDRLAKEQLRVSSRTGELSAEMKRNEAVESSATEEEPTDANDDPSSSAQDLEADSQEGSGKSSENTKSPTSQEGESEESKASNDAKPASDERQETSLKDRPATDKAPGSEDTKNESKDGTPSDSESNPSAAPPSSAPSSPTQPQNSGESGDSQQPSQQQQEFPGQERIRQAEEKMKQAEQKLAEAKRKAAVRDEEDAARMLAEAKAELEELLRQKREEEIGRTLAMLESRFRKMLEMELEVYESTMRLYKIPPARRDRFVDIEAGKLSFQQRRILVEADKCLALLQEEGSSVAFPESVEQIREDMERVEQRLGRSQIGRMTQGIEEEIIEALDEMIDALQQAQRDQEARQQQSPSGPMQMSEDQSLVDKIAELKMLKAMQKRINKRTTTYSRLLDDDQDSIGQATDEELIDALQELADRELRLQTITHDIVVGKNQ